MVPDANDRSRIATAHRVTRPTYARLCPACSDALGLDQALVRMFRRVTDEAIDEATAGPPPGPTTEPSIHDPEHDAALAGLAELFGAKRRVSR